jgi:hypothetical protein
MGSGGWGTLGLVVLTVCAVTVCYGVLQQYFAALLYASVFAVMLIPMNEFVERGLSRWGNRHCTSQVPLLVHRCPPPPAPVACSGRGGEPGGGGGL